VNVHKNAKLTPAGRALLVARVVEQGQRQVAVAAAVGVSPRTVAKWVQRWRAEGVGGLVDRSSRPQRCPHRLGPARVRQIARLRRRRWSSPWIARALQLPVSTVVVTVRRLGLNRLRQLEPRGPVIRYERARPGELVHVDTKKLGRIVRVGHRIHGDRTQHGPHKRTGWEYLHVCVDDATRLAYSEVLPAETGPSAAGFLRRAAVWFGTLGVRIERVMTDNAWAYGSHAYRTVLETLRARHLRTRPYTPRTNGKAERFIQTSLREWAYRRPYGTSQGRQDALPAFLRHYNTERPHTALQQRPPLARFFELREQRPC
jgi:transposase InsO family protein